MKRRVFLKGVLLGAAPLLVQGAEGNAAALDHQISVTASTTGRFREGHSWNLSVNSAGRAHLVIDSRPSQAREFTVSTAQLRELLEVMERERFFELKGPFGETVPDGSTEVLTIVDGGVANSVEIRYLMGWQRDAPRKLKDPARALRVFRMVRGWFNDKEAVNLTKYGDMVITAAARVE